MRTYLRALALSASSLLVALSPAPAAPVASPIESTKPDSGGIHPGGSITLTDTATSTNPLGTSWSA